MNTGWNIWDKYLYKFLDIKINILVIINIGVNNFWNVDNVLVSDCILIDCVVIGIVVSEDIYKKLIIYY